VRVTVLLPVLDEAQNLPAVLGDLARWSKKHNLPVEAVVCDNGSTDDSSGVARALGAKVVHAPARGYGNALKAGIAAVETPLPDVFVILDADGSCVIDDLDALLAPLAAGEADLVIGDRTRLAESGSLTRAQRAGNAVATRLIAASSGLRTRDMGPFRAIRTEALLALGMSDPTWGWNVEMHLKAARQRLRVREVPVRYRPRAAGESKISGSWRGAARAGVRMLQACWRYA
jgi:glycosyltransferase involved in cell wall biosynthesis